MSNAKMGRPVGTGNSPALVQVAYMVTPKVRAWLAAERARRNYTYTGLIEELVLTYIVQENKRGRQVTPWPEEEA